MMWQKSAILVLLLGITACHKTNKVAVPTAPVTSVALVEGEEAFDNGDFARAARGYESYLQTNPQNKELDCILFRFGVAQSMSGVKAREDASSEIFNQLIRDYPKSPCVPPARMILSLRADVVRLSAEQKSGADKAKQLEDRVKQLNDELDKLKKIDLDRRRTP